ncbi:hypothetical protein [Streptomyces sp. MST-110588]|uniref:terpene synthase family protein n=1 Tax=Streptomyces sp. MST-110588 TaxID=2833628 RepID=UPI001F5C5EE6|nr:hypothetical protein [Streptomyces sp. MST-110588]UNO38928.1 hypothetical protein KGS77_03830 [Streptomyces sp. MST-110588]
MSDANSRDADTRDANSDANGRAEPPVEDPGSLVVPALSFPFPARLHPDADALEQRLLDWMRTHHLDRSGAEVTARGQQMVGRAGAWLCPTGPIDRVTLACYTVLWMATLDDRLSEPAARTGELTALAHHWLAFDRILMRDPHHRTRSALESALHDLWQRLSTVAGPGQLARLHQAILLLGHGFTAEAVHATARKPPTLAEYRHIRHATSGLGIYTVVLEIAGGFELPLSVVQEPEVQTLTTLAIEIVTTTNEIVTCPSDVGLGDDLNLAVLLAREHGTTVQEGMEEAATELRRLTDRFLHLCEHLGARNPEAIEPYTAALKDFIAGHLAWLAETDRYAASNRACARSRSLLRREGDEGERRRGASVGQ